MAVRNRALTIATRGLLSAAAVTIATHGLIQIPTGIAPPIEIPVTAPAQGGGVRAPGEVFKLEYPALHKHRSVLNVEFTGDSDFGHVHTAPADHAYRTALDLYMWGDSTSARDALYTARSSLAVRIVSQTESDAAYVVVVPAHGTLVLDGAAYLRGTHPGWFDFAEPAGLVLGSGATFGHERVVDEDEPRIIPAVYRFESDGTIEITGAADVRQAPVPPVEHIYRSDHEYGIGGTVDASLLRVDTIEYVEHVFTSSDAITATIAGTATYAATTTQNVDARVAGALDMTMYGTGAVTFRRTIEILPQAYNDDDEVLVLFAYMMSDES